MSQNRLTVIGGYLRQNWRRVTLLGLGSIPLILILVQVAFPRSSLPPYMTIDGVELGGRNVDDASKLLNEKYKSLRLDVYFGASPKPYQQPTTADVGMNVETKERVNSATYPWWLRLVPTSLWWAHSTITPKDAQYTVDKDKAQSYLVSVLGESCEVKAVNANLTYKDGSLAVVPAIDGGKCQLDKTQERLVAARPVLTNKAIRIDITPHPAKFRDDEAKTFLDTLTKQTKDGTTIAVSGQRITVPKQELLSWLDFTASDEAIVASINKDRSNDFFTKQLLPKVTVAPGTSKVTTLDFTEVSRTNGAAGRTLDSEATIATLNSWLKGDGTPEAKTKVVPPTVVYTRTYTPTDTGLSALIAQFAQGRKGTFGISFAELDGKKRRADFQADKVFRTASTYKVFVAYAAFKRVEAGTWRMNDQITGGRDLTKCLDDMIVKSDNPCGEALLAKIGYKTLTNELKAIGLTKSSFTNSVPETSARDLTTFVGSLNAGQLLNQSNTASLISMMKRNIYRQGIPAGASGQVANKVGFLDAYLHDAGIIYSPGGTYALTIMSEGSSWATIAELTREIEKLRSQ